MSSYLVRPGVYRVPLTKGEWALVSAEDFRRVMKRRWHWRPLGPNGYAATNAPRNRKKQRTIYLHRFILDAPIGIRVDHIDGDGLNCVRENMRLATAAQNAHNMPKKKANATSRFKGVCRHDDAADGTPRWTANIRAFKKEYHLGLFADEELAARCYDVAAKYLHGDFAYPNFPDSTFSDLPQNVADRVAFVLKMNIMTE